MAWDSYAQRPHYFARYFLARGGGAVLWVDPYPNRLPGLADLRRPEATRARADPDPRVGVLRVPAWPIEPLPGGPVLNRALRWGSAIDRLARVAVGTDAILGVGRPSALALLALARLPAVSRFYDAMDDFPEFYSGLSRRSMRRREDAVLRAVDRVYAASDALVKKFARAGVKATLVANAYAMASLPRFAPRPPGAPVVFGYVGTVGRWFDWDLVRRIAAAHPDGEVRIVGPVHLRHSSDMPGNVRLLGECTQAEAVAHLQGFSCGLIPFRLTALTAAVDPIKYYEYRAMGLPVVSTRFGQMEGRGGEPGVFLTDGIDVAPARRALRYVADAAEVARFRAENDWAVRFDRASLFHEAGALPV